MTTARLTQQAAEALLQPVPKARLSQQAGEVLLRPAPRARVTGQALEVLRTVADGAVASPRRPVTIMCVAA
jgi:hypothetical protein